MVKILSPEELKTLTLKELKSQAKALENEGYAISYESLKASPLEGEELLAFYRKKIRHAQRSGTGGVQNSGRREELSKLSKRSKNHELDLLTIATSLSVPKRTILTKDQLIEAILEAEASGKVATKVRPASVPKKRGRPKKTETVSSASIEAPPPSPKKAPSSPKKSKSPSPDCGKYDYKELLGKRLSELKAILAKKGVKDSSNVESVEQAANMVCSLKKNKEMCDESNDYACSDGRVCDASSNPGVCVEQSMVNGLSQMQYEGRTIVGTQKAIDNLKEKLGVKEESSSGDGACNQSNGYKCDDGNVCDVASSSCVDKGKVADMIESGDDVEMLEYEGRQIIGSKSAIKNLRKMLGVPKQSRVSPNDFARNYLIERATLVSGKPASYFKKYTEKQLYIYLEGHGIKELSNAKKSLIKKLAKQQNRKKGDFSDLDLDELQRRAELIRGQQESEEEAGKYNRENMIEAIAAWTQTPPENYVNWSNYALRQRLESLQDWEKSPKKKGKRSSEEEKISKQDRQDMIEALAEWTGASPKKYKNWSNYELKQRLEGLRERRVAKTESVSSDEEEVKEEKVTPPVVEDSSSEEEKPAPAKKEIKREEIEKVLSDVMSGKKDNIEEFSQAQNAVLKCLGLIA